MKSVAIREIDEQSIYHISQCSIVVSVKQLLRVFQLTDNKYSSKFSFAMFFWDLLHLLKNAFDRKRISANSVVLPLLKNSSVNIL